MSTPFSMDEINSVGSTNGWENGMVTPERLVRKEPGYIDGGSM